MNIGNIKDLTLSYGKTEILEDVLESFNLNREESYSLNKIISSKSRSDLSSWLTKHKMKKNVVDKLLTLLECNGDLSVISTLKAVKTDEKIVNELEEIWSFIEKETSFKPHIDVTDFPGFNYHKGLVFSAHSEKLGFSIANGGSYFSQTASGSTRIAIGFDQDIIAMTKLKA